MLATVLIANAQTPSQADAAKSPVTPAASTPTDPAQPAGAPQTPAPRKHHPAPTNLKVLPKEITTKGGCAPKPQNPKTPKPQNPSNG